LSLLLFVTLLLSQKAQEQEKDDRSLPMYDLQTDSKTKRVVDAVTLLQKSKDKLQERIPARSFL